VSGRPQNQIGGTGPVADQARQLRLLREHAGLTLRDLAELTKYSLGTLSRATAGRALPTWEVTEAIVRACGGNLPEWADRWKEAAEYRRLPKAMNTPARIRTQPVGPAGRDLVTHGWGPPPIPVAAETSAGFMDCLRRVKIWAGDPPVRTLARRAKMSPSTVHDILRNKSGNLPSVEAVCAILTACGIEDTSVLGEWVYAWRRLKFAEVEARRQRAARNLISIPRKSLGP
jgi:transcriptional regulator with XRE-family HTH domain